MKAKHYFFEIFMEKLSFTDVFLAWGLAIKTVSVKTGCTEIEAAALLKRNKTINDDISNLMDGGTFNAFKQALNKMYA